MACDELLKNLACFGGLSMKFIRRCVALSLCVSYLPSGNQTLGKAPINGPLSIAMFDYRRVIYIPIHGPKWAMNDGEHDPQISTARMVSQLFTMVHRLK